MGQKVNLLEICGALNRKDIYLLGNRDCIEDFINKQDKKINIKGILTDHNEELRLQYFKKYNLETLWLEDQKLGSNSFILICAGKMFGSTRLRLMYKGLKEYQDFLSCNLVEQIIDNKKTIIFMGPPILHQVSDKFVADRRIKDNYNIIYFSDTDLREPYADRSSELIHTVKCSSAYITVCCEKTRYLFKDINPINIPDDCTRISVSDCGFLGYHPQIGNDRENYSSYFLRGYSRYEMEYSSLAFAHEDSFLVELCKYERTDTIFEKIMDYNFFATDFISKNWKKEIRKMEEIDLISDIPLSNYYKTHDNILLNVSQDELSATMVNYVCNEILKKLKIDYLIEDKESCVSGTELEVYPSIQKYFGLEEELKNRKYQVVTYEKKQFLPLEEYFRYHIEYLKNAIELNRLTHMNGGQ